MHVVFGAGQVGSGLARKLAAAGLPVRVVRRSASAVGEGIEVMAGDARDPAFVLRASEGARVIYHCMNPSSYSKKAWEQEFPAMGEAMIAAAVAHRARLVCLDNVYGYGVTEGPRTESTPMAATGAKGGVRVKWDQRLREAAIHQGLRYVVGRAGDFFGPGSGDQSLLSTTNLTNLDHGRPVLLIGNPKATHGFSYVPDVITGLAALGRAEADVEGQVFHLPVVQVAPLDLVKWVAAARGVRARTRTVPGWVIRLFGVVAPFFAELTETLYQWDRDFWISDAKFRARFPGLATPPEQAARAV
jgi:nucleoside-diphosphate-sugar epimerase